jgi:hypothetical protein
MWTGSIIPQFYKNCKVIQSDKVLCYQADILKILHYESPDWNAVNLQAGTPRFSSFLIDLFGMFH